MLTIQLQKSLAETKPVPFTPKRLVDAPPQPRATATNTAPWYTHLYANPLQNGRLAAPLRATSWRVRWSVALAAPPGAVLRADNRILVQGGGWQLLALDGKLVAQGTGGRSAASVDPTNALFYLINGSSYLEARFLNNGDLSFQSPLLTNERFAWPLIARSGDRLLMAGVEQKMASHVPRPGTRSEIDLLEFAFPQKLDMYKQILSLKGGGILHFDKTEMVFAAGGNKIYAVAPNYVVITDNEFNVEAVYEAEFKPISIAVDESGYIYLIVETGGRRAYWVITPDGKRIVAVNLGDEHQSVGLPPIVAHNHQTYLLTRSSVIAFSPEGKLIWEHQAAGDVAGASITQDDKLLIAAGAELIILDSSNREIGRHRFEGEQLRTAPVLTRVGEGDELLVGTNAHVYSLIPD